MRNIFIALLVAFVMVSCGGDKEKTSSSTSSPEPKPQQESQVPASQRVDLTNKGVGPISSVTFDDEINEQLAAQGEKVYNELCTACHKTDTKFIGPPPKDIFERRTPEWVMNMILVPEEMVKKDALARDLLKEYNGSPMSNQNLTEEQARAILEYFRTL